MRALALIAIATGCAVPPPAAAPPPPPRITPGPEPAPAPPAEPALPPQPDPPPEVAADPHALPADQVAALTADLDERASKALAAGDLARAIPLLRGLVAARGAVGEAARELAGAWVRAGDYAAAIEVYDEILAGAPDPSIEKARAKIAGARSPIERGVRLEPPTAVSRERFRLGRRASVAGDHRVALLHYRVGQAIDPDLPGFLREIAATYKALGDREAMIAHYLAYLRRRPVGKLADAARRAVAGSAALGALDISSSLPCDEVWLAGQRLSRALPVTNLAIPAGRYRGLCVSYTHEIAYFERVAVPAGGRAQMVFSWAIVENRLENPRGRIAVEDPRRPKVMMDLGITSPAVGVVVPPGGGALRMRLRSDDGSRKLTRTVTIAPGSRIVVRW